MVKLRDSARVLALASMLCLSGTVLAEGWYAGAGLARTTANDFKDPAQFVGSVDGNATGKELFAGMRLHENVAVELAYVDLGELSFNGTWNGVSDYGTIRTTGMKASVMGMLPFGNPWRLFGKVGMFKWKADEDEVYAGIPESSSASGTDPVFGIGIQVDVHDYVDVRAEWERHNSLGDNSGYTDAFSAKFVWSFL